MKLFAWRWLAISNLLIAAVTARAETRPQYGGALRVTMQARLASLNPADPTQPSSFAQRNIMRLAFDTLVVLDDDGHPQPALATSWQPAGKNQPWRFLLRNAVKFHDGTPLSSELAADSLRAANPTWKVSADGGSLVIQCDCPDLLSELALPRNSIIKNDSNESPSGTGPFHIVEWQTGTKLTLAANEDYWDGRPFLDSIEIEMGKSFRDQLTAFQLGRVDLMEVAPEQSHRLSLGDAHLASSLPMELVALVFARDAPTDDEKLLRAALALSIDRGSMRSVLLQGAGQPATSLLPNWMSGYAFIFPAETDLSHARRERSQVRTIPTWTLGYDANDSLERLLAERVSLNAKDVGLSLQPTPASTTDLRLMRIPLASAEPWIALSNVNTTVGVPMPKISSNSVEDLYSAERAELETQKIIPLLHLPLMYASSFALKDSTLRPDGTWKLADAWLENKQR
jgi:peptide/nickel transport system substrate-binding protein